MIWNFQVFTQVWIIRNARPEEDYFLMSIYSFVESFGKSEYGYGSAIAVVTVLTLLAVTFVYIRQMVRIGELEEAAPRAPPGRAQRHGPLRVRRGRVPGLLDGRDGVQAGAGRPLVRARVAAARPDRELPRRDLAASSGWRPQQPHRRVFVVAASLVLAFLAALALAKFRFYGRRPFIVVIFAVQMVPLTALIIPLYIALSSVGQVDKLTA